jgi:hypothetical protein
MPYNVCVTFIETTLFTKLIYVYLSDEEYAALQFLLAAHPEIGDIVPGSGGVRKLRWGTSGRGKRGGLRIIYYWKTKQDEIWLLTLYAKNEASTIPSHVLRRIAEEIKNG